MGKAPAFQFYVKDWLSDPQLRLVSPSTKGIWIDLLCYMWCSTERGMIEMSVENIGKLTGSKNGEVQLFIDEAQGYDFCDIFVTDNGWLQIYNRRMYRETKDKENNRLRQQKYRERHRSNGKITPLSPSPSPSSATIKAKKPPDLEKKKKGKSKGFELPDWVEKDMWLEFKKYRKEINAPVTTTGEKLLLADLKKLVDSGENQTDVINQSIKSGKWKGLFAVKRDFKQENTGSHSPIADKKFADFKRMVGA